MSPSEQVLGTSEISPAQKRSTGVNLEHLKPAMAAETEHDLVPQNASAAVMIQKTYRGYRARRKLADAAIMSKTTGWWNVVDSVVLQQHTQQYYAHSKSWKANDNWKRLKRKASKVGKGLQKNHKALKLVLQHWLEAVDARHRYGHNLRPYYLHWHDLDTNEPFFYWLDLGSGRQLELPKCSRAVLHEQQITYLSPDQRKHYEVAIYHGKLYYVSSGELVHTSEIERWIFVMSPSYKLYIAKKQKGKFQHSSFLAGGATTAAGRVSVVHGVLKLMEAHSGHYRPSPENFEALVGVLVNHGADLHLANVQLVSDDLLEKKRAKELAGQVRQAIEGTWGDSTVEVNVRNQRLVSVDSIDDESTDYVVTNITFPSTTEPANETQPEPAETGSKADSKATRKHAEEPATTEPAQQGTDNGNVPENHTSSGHGTGTAEPEAAEVEEKVVAARTEDASVAAVVGAVEPPPVISTEGGDPVTAKKKPAALVLPIASLLEEEAQLGLKPSPKTSSTLPTSPGFSRNSHLANLGAAERRQALKRYGPRKIGFQGGKPIPENTVASVLTC